MIRALAPVSCAFGRSPRRAGVRRASRWRQARAVAAGLALATTLLGVFGELAAHQGAIWNGSESLPFGLYWRQRGPPYPVAPGDYVVICAPAPAARLAMQRGYLSRDVLGRGCGGGANPILKRVYGVAGDHYEVSAYGVILNGAIVHDSAPLRQDDRGRPLWDGRPRDVRLGSHQVLVLSAYNPASYDSRYFGALDERSVLARVRPVLTAPYDARF